MSCIKQELNLSMSASVNIEIVHIYQKSSKTWNKKGTTKPNIEIPDSTWKITISLILQIG